MFWDEINVYVTESHGGNVTKDYNLDPVHCKEETRLNPKRLSPTTSLTRSDTLISVREDQTPAEVRVDTLSVAYSYVLGTS